MNLLKIILAVILLIVLGLAFVIVQPQAFLPHERIIISIPFDKIDPPTYMIPMGETIAHPKPQVPNGHPGIDFQWNHSANILSSSEGEVTRITYNTSDAGTWDVEVQSGVYLLRYKELDSYNSSLRSGVHVQKRSFIGHPGNFSFPDGTGHYQTHWEFASVSLVRDRFCPVTYFDNESRQIVNGIWDKVPANDTFKSKFPYICSGDYYNKTE